MVRERQFYRTLFTIALPSAFQGLISLLVNMVDNIMISWVPGNGDLTLAAVTMSNTATTFYNSLILGLVSGSAVLISQYWGKRDMVRIKQIFSVVSMICMGVSLACVAAVLLFPDSILVLFTDRPQIIEAALPYFTLVCFSYIPFAMSSALVGMLRSIEVVRITLYTTIVALFTNIGFNYVLIFGHLGMPAMGMRGAGLATLLARLVELAIVWHYTFRVQKRIDLRPRDLLKSPGYLWRDYARFGLPVGIGDMQWALVGLFKAAIIGRLGEVMIAANSIAETMMNLGMIFTSSLASAACIVIGKSVGSGDYAKTRQYSNTIQIMFFLFGLVMSLIVFALRVPFAQLYQVSGETHQLAMQMIGLGAITLIGTTYHASCFVGINRGAGDSKFVMIVDMICGWLIVLPLSYLAAFVWHLPLPYMFLVIRIDQCFKWIIAFLRLRGNKWIKNVTREGVGA